MEYLIALLSSPHRPGRSRSCTPSPPWAWSSGRPGRARGTGATPRGRAGLTEVRGDASHALSGRAGNLRVRLSRYEGGGAYGTRIVVSGPGLPAERDGAARGLRADRSGDAHVREIEIGDEGFDHAAWVEGPPALVRSLLDADTRRTLRGLFEGRLERPRLSPFWAEGRLDEGVLRVDVPEVVPAAPEDRRSGLLSEAQGLETGADACYVGGPGPLPEVLRAVLALAAPSRPARGRPAPPRREPEGRARGRRPAPVPHHARRGSSRLTRRRARRSSPRGRTRTPGCGCEPGSHSAPRAATCCSRSRAARAPRTRPPSRRSSPWGST